MTDIDNEITLDTPLYRCVLKKSRNVMSTIFKGFVMDVAIPFILPSVVSVYLLHFSNVIPYFVELGRAFGAFLLIIPAWITLSAILAIGSLSMIGTYSYMWCLARRNLLNTYSKSALKWGIPLALFRDSSDTTIVSVAIPYDQFYYGIIDSIFNDTGGRNYMTDVKIYGDVVLEPFRCVTNTVLALDYLNEQLHIPSKIVILNVDEYNRLQSAQHLGVSHAEKTEEG